MKVHHEPIPVEPLKPPVLYCDYAATSPIPAAVQNTIENMLMEYYNPSSTYQQAKNLSTVLWAGRNYLATIMGAKPERFYFTSGGSEANNWIINSWAQEGKANGKMHIISTMIEHPSVLIPLANLESQGFKLSLVRPDENGIVSPEQIEKEIRDDTAFVSVMFANNEIGTLQPISEIGNICRKHNVLFHTDAVQAVGHIPIDITKQNIDALSFSSHKFGGMKGVGGLVCSERANLMPMILGGGQEFGMRSGTENTIGIISTIEAFRESYIDIYSKSAALYITQQKLLTLIKTIPDVKVNADLHIDKLPNNINVSFKGVSGQSLALMMAGDGILVSTQSACSVNSGKHSHVLEAIGVPEEYIDGTIRITFGRELSEDEIRRIYNSIKTNVEKLRSVN